MSQQVDSYSRSGLPAALRRALTVRLAGPGGLYTIGNTIGLGMGLGLALQASEITRCEGACISSVLQAGHLYLLGSWSAVALTVATAIFFWSSEEYRRAWSKGLPDPARIQRGDFLSGIGSIALGVSLLLIGNPLLAATSGLLHAAGKFGSAFKREERGRIVFGVTLPELFRISVLLSRFPAIVLALMEMARVFSSDSPASFRELAMPATLLVCYSLWSAADILLFERNISNGSR
jgi:hypothetical protein